MVSVGFLAQRDLSSSAIVPCLAGIVQEAEQRTQGICLVCGLCLAHGMWILYPHAGVKEPVPAFRTVEWRGCSEGPCRDTGSALWSSWGWAQAGQKPLLAVSGFKS